MQYTDTMAGPIIAVQYYEGQVCIITDRHVTAVTRDNNVDFVILTGIATFKQACVLIQKVKLKTSNTNTLGPRIARELKAVEAAPHRKERKVLHMNEQCTDV